MIVLPPETTQEIAHALDRHGLRPRTITLVSPLRERKGRRWAYRVETEDGRLVKARQFENREVASQVFTLRTGLEDAFAPALARYGPVLIEAWIDGVPLAELAWDAWEDAGALLGRLHAHPLGTDAPSTLPTRKWRDGAHSDLELLRDAGALTDREVASLRAEIGQRDPVTARAAIIHMDYCADNMLIDVHGRLRIIDNEQVAIAPIGFDLGRTFHLWPMPDAAWVRFRTGYESSAPAPPDALGFWRIIATLVGARVFQHRSPVQFDASLALLRRFVAGQYLSDP